MNEKYQVYLQRAIALTRAILDTYDQLQSAPGNAGNPGISEEAEWVRRWLTVLEDQPSPDDVNDVWREVQDSGRILDAIWKPVHLSKRKARLLDELFTAMIDLVAEVRRLHS